MPSVQSGPTSVTSTGGITRFTNDTRILTSATDSSGASFTTAANRASLFSGGISGIPSDTINSKKGQIGTFGSTTSGENMTFQLKFWNGTSLSDLAIWAGAGGTDFVAAGSNDYEPTACPFGSDCGNGTTPIAGGTGELHGISWSPSTQADWGWALFCTAITSTPIGGMLRGIALKIYYDEAPPNPRPIYNNGAAMLSTKSGNIVIGSGNINIGI
jgi:hypothetical protein